MRTLLAIVAGASLAILVNAYGRGIDHAMELRKIGDQIQRLREQVSELQKKAGVEK